MKKPSELFELLKELRTEDIKSDVETINRSKAVIFLNDEASENDDGIRLSAEDCVLLFASLATAKRFIEALDSKEASLALFDITVPPAILEELERNFISVDEG